MNISRFLYQPGTWRGRVQNPQRFVTHCACALVVKLLPCSVRSATLLSTTFRTAGRPSGTSTLVSESEHTPAPTVLLPFPPLNQSSFTQSAMWPCTHKDTKISLELPQTIIPLQICEQLWRGYIIWNYTYLMIKSINFFPKRLQSFEH